MFDIGFSEILVIAGLSLVVLGPDKLPRVVRTVGRWAGRARAMARQFRDQLEAEADNLKVDLNSQTAADGARPPGNSPAAAAAAAAPVPPAEFTGAPVEPSVEPSVEPPVEAPAGPPVEAPVEPAPIAALAAAPTTTPADAAAAISDPAAVPAPAPSPPPA